MPVLDPTALIDQRTAAIRAYHDATGLPRAELDISGGVDSALTLMLLARALDPGAITATYSSIHSSDASRDRARQVARAAGVPLLEIELSDIFDTLTDQVLVELGRRLPPAEVERARAAREADPTVDGSLRSCLRAPLGRYLNRLRGPGLRHGTGNEDEDRWLRFFQKGGDGEVDTNPLAMLSKGEVYQLAVAIGVPRDIIVAPPTPDLWGVGEAHTDEEELSRISGVAWTYSRIDPDTGAYTRLGTIERYSRLLDRAPAQGSATWAATLLDPAWSTPGELAPDLLADVASLGLSFEHLLSARRWERSTRHKTNPNIPTLGTRAELRAAGLLSDDIDPSLPAA